MSFDVKVRERILKPVGEVFDAVVDPLKMANYFISSASSPIEQGANVVWEFADVGAKVAIDVLKVRKDSEIVYESSALGQLLRTTITFEADGSDATVITIVDSSFELNEEGVKRALGQNAGWTYTLCGLKAYLQFGINLRTGLNKRLTDV
ncbi:SRPBCC domain-containing protein [Sphingomonas sp. MMSM20]|uniref:SRPBCC domain-containing protein n=1 Tax=Sphingomonas lycopersici TaxID=2951807 RepID=UPI00223896E3|nr:SRPBCC domain-containing protein [Sphingomonas lycopersici]MCW6532237.1 SRPBCC domain-containing protein [Sphingomonas lycopersici]